MLHVLALDLSLRKLRVNLALSRNMLPGATTSAKYTAYVDDVPTLVTSNA